MAGADLLSGLSDDLLASVISLLDTREAVRTAALSRRWRPVWLRTHSLNLDSRSYSDCSEHPVETNACLVSDAGEFLSAAGRGNHVRKLSLSVFGRDGKYFEHVMGNSMWAARRDLMASLLAAPALRYLEEVRVKLELIKQGPSEPEKLSSWVYKLDPAQLPGHTLRVLDLEFCRLDSAAAVSLHLLSSLRLYKCSSSTNDLEDWIRTALSLASMHIQDHNFYCPRYDGTRRDRFELHSPSLTTLTLVSGSWTNKHFELDVPRLHAFRRRFSKEMVPLMLHQDDGCSQPAVLPGLTGCWFPCLQNHVKSVTLQFESKELNSFEVCLAKFFAENCMVLEVLQIDDGRQNFLSHLNWTVERWRANAPKPRKQMECDSADSSKQSGKRKRNYRAYSAE